MQRIAVVAKLRPGTAEQAARLIELGPPFDPLDNGLERHMVFLAADTAVFVFEGGDPHAVLGCAQRSQRAVGARRVGAAGRRHSEDRPRGVLLDQPGVCALERRLGRVRRFSRRLSDDSGSAPSTPGTVRDRGRGSSSAASTVSPWDRRHARRSRKLAAEVERLPTGEEQGA